MNRRQSGKRAKRRKRVLLASDFLLLMTAGWMTLRTANSFFRSQADEERMIEDGMPYLFQTDPEWAAEQYGDRTIEQTGCGPTSLAMALSSILNQNFSPLEIASWSEQNGYYVDGAGSSWDLFTDYPAQFGIPVFQSGDINELTERLRQNAILIFSMNPGDFTTSGHIITVKNIDEEGNVNVHDPNSEARSKKWSLNTLLGQAAAVFVLPGF